MSRHELFTPDAILMEEDRNTAGERLFVKRFLNGVECHGRVAEIDHHEVFNGKWHKLFNTLVRNEPYQLAHQTSEYTMRVESISDGYPEGVIDFCMYGNYLGRLQVGDEVIVKAKDFADRRVVKSIYNLTTESDVKPAFQFPAGFIKCFFITALLLMIALIYKLVWFVKSGAAIAGVIALLNAFMPAVIICAGLYIIVRSILPGRRKRKRR